jgi:predicted aldo/keto reductase-like oxidoreductase
VYLFHHLNQDEAQKLEKFNLLKKMEEAKESGIIKHFGFSFHDTLPSFKQIVDMYPWEICQIQYNYMDTGVQATTEGLKYAHSKGLAVVIMEPLRGGYLANPPKEALDIMNKSPIKRTPVDWALQFLWNRPEISVVLSGMSNMKQLQENVESANRSGVNSLSQEENQIIEELAAVFNKNIVVPCTACNYCMPCPHGVNIPQNFAFLNAEGMRMGSFENRFMQAFVRMRYKRLASNKRELKIKPNNGKASLCVKCGACKPKCPQNIDIPTCLEKADLVLSKKKKLEELF